MQNSVVIPKPSIDVDALRQYRLKRIQDQMRQDAIDVLILTNPISLRYAVDFRTYALFNAHIPTTYLFVSVEGPIILFGAYGPTPMVDIARPGRPISFFDGGDALSETAALLADDVDAYFSEIGLSSGRVAIEYVNPSVTQAVMRKGYDVVDGVRITEKARLIKSSEEIACIRHAVDVAELGMARVQEALRPGVTEVELLALFNYVNISHDGDWQDGRMLSSGDRINPWCQEASDARIEDGDLVGLDTDMIGPFGYFADISRTFFCGTGLPSNRQLACPH